MENTLANRRLVMIWWLTKGPGKSKWGTWAGDMAQRRRSSLQVPSGKTVKEREALHSDHFQLDLNAPDLEGLGAFGRHNIAVHLA